MSYWEMDINGAYPDRKAGQIYEFGIKTLTGMEQIDDLDTPLAIWVRYKPDKTLANSLEVF